LQKTGFHFSARRADQQPRRAGPCRVRAPLPPLAPRDAQRCAASVVQRWREDANYSLRGRFPRRLSADRDERSHIADAADYARTLSETFALDLAEAATLWPAIRRRHADRFDLR
jgi:hypothetical protein